MNAPEQVLLEKSYGLIPHFPDSSAAEKLFIWKCESIKAPTFNDARVLIISRPNMLDDGVAYTLVQPRGSATARLLPFSEGGNLFWGSEDDRHNLAAMNAVLQTKEYGQPESIDWLAISLAYLTILGEEPSLTDRHYSPSPDEHFPAYTVPGLLTELPFLTKKHLLPTLTCTDSLYRIRFYYRTEPVEPLKIADFTYSLEDRTLRLLRAEVKHHAPGIKK